MSANGNHQRLSDGRLRLVVAGYIVGGPLGGLVWHHLQYLLGLRALGHEVLFVEDSDDYPSCYHPERGGLGDDPSYGLAFLQTVFDQHGLMNQWSYRHRSSNTWYGMNEAGVTAFARTADAFLNLSGLHPVGEPFHRIPVRVLVDTDPVFTQIRHLTNEEAHRRAADHNRFLTYAENWGGADCAVPDDGFPWRPTRQPVYVPAWPVTEGSLNAAWSTVMQWDSYQTRTHEGKVYGMKSKSFEAFMRLPQQTNERFTLAIGNATAPREALAEAGWRLVDSLSVTKTPEHYQQFIQSSKGEWSVAKHGYVASRSGWFSERTAGYLASGRPAVVQDTAWTNCLETGRGLFAFRSADEAKIALDEVNRGYNRHCRWARELAETQFGHRVVLRRLLDDCLAAQTVGA